MLNVQLLFVSKEDFVCVLFVSIEAFVFVSIDSDLFDSDFEFDLFDVADCLLFDSTSF